MSAEVIASIASAVAAAGAACTAWLSFRAQKRALRQADDSLNVQRSAQTGTALLELVITGYLDRTFSSTEPPVIDGVPINSLRQAKRKLRSQRSSQEWDAESVVEDTPANRIAYELAIALERLGVAVFTGVVPVQFFLSLAADRVLEDWELCYHWIEKYRGENGVVQAGSDVQFHRRHAEWLALLSALWMNKWYSNYPAADKFLGRIGIETVARRFASYIKTDAQIMPDDVRREIASILGLQESELVEGTLLGLTAQPNNGMQRTHK